MKFILLHKLGPTMEFDRDTWVNVDHIVRFCDGEKDGGILFLSAPDNGGTRTMRVTEDMDTIMQRIVEVGAAKT